MSKITFYTKSLLPYDYSRCAGKPKQSLCVICARNSSGHQYEQSQVAPRINEEGFCINHIDVGPLDFLEQCAYDWALETKDD